MNSLKPSIVTVDKLVASAKNAPIVVINGTPFVDGFDHIPYYSNVVKRIIAAGYVLFGKGMVVRYTKDAYKKSEIKTIDYRKAKSNV